MLDKILGFHIEPTNMCTLKCPKCSRTTFIEKFPSAWTNKNLNLDHLKKFLDIDLTNKVINLCGTYGDAIYYPDLFKMIEYFKNAGSKIVLSTNGSYKTYEWWQELTSILDSQDSIIFGIDGKPNTFTQYRVNADWKTIKIGIDVTTKTNIKVVWQYIPFAFNENDIEEVSQLSKDLGFDEFLLYPSDRWDEDDPLKPSKFISNHSLPKDHWKTDIVKIRKNEIDPICKKLNNQHYISADGFYTPCCFSSEHHFYYKSEFYKNKENYDISKTTISQLLQSEQSINFYNTLEDAKLTYCTFNCPSL